MNDEQYRAPTNRGMNNSILGMECSFVKNFEVFLYNTFFCLGNGNVALQASQPAVCKIENVL